MLKREWGAESNGTLPHLFIPSKTATQVLEFAMEDLPLGRITALVPEFVVKDLPLGRTHDNDVQKKVKPQNSVSQTFFKQAYRHTKNSSILATQINYRGTAVEVLKQVPSRFHIRDNVKIILLYVYYLIFICITTLLP